MTVYFVFCANGEFNNYKWEFKRTVRNSNGIRLEINLNIYWQCHLSHLSISLSFYKTIQQKKEEKPKCRKSICVMVLLSSSNPKQHLILFFLKITIARFIHSAFKWILINACFVERWMQKGILILYQKHDILVNMLFPLRTHTQRHIWRSQGLIKIFHQPKQSPYHFNFFALHLSLLASWIHNLIYVNLT